MKAKTTITIGIPAYNEEDNINLLVSDLLSQVQEEFQIKKIIIASDGSTDNTVNLLKKFRHDKVKVIDGKKQKGVAYRQNQIMSQTQEEILILLNADIRIKDKMFVSKLVGPIKKHKYDLVSGKSLETDPINFLEKIIYVSMLFKNLTFETYKNGNNFFTCHGTVRAFSKKFYKQLKFKQSFGEDLYSYLYCIKHRFKYHYSSQANIYYKLPDKFLDHLRQSTRFYYSLNRMKDEFGSCFVDYHTNWPARESFAAGIKIFIKFPHLFLLYIPLALMTAVASKLKNYPQTQIWSTTISSKKISMS